MHRFGQVVACLLFFLGLVLAVGANPGLAGETDLVKLDSQGNELPADAKEWVMVRDRINGLIWEVKTRDGSVHDIGKTFSYNSAMETFIPELNTSRFGGFSDWRLPTTDELRTIQVKGSEPAVNPDFFPNTASTSYLSWRKCGNGDIYDERVKFGSERNTKNDRRVRAVRSDVKE